jgi:antitoxin CcdA
MQIKDVRPEPYTKQLRCDRCGLLSEAVDVEFSEFASIDMKAGYGSIFGDGNDVQVDLCQHCVKAVLGGWLRVTSSDDRAREQQELLDRFDPERHGGDFPKSDAGGNKRRLGFLKEKLVVPDDFDAPLPEDVFKDRPD